MSVAFPGGGPGGAGLSLDQAPPLAVPIGFFVLAPLAMIALGLLLVGWGIGVVASPWQPRTIAATHLGTLGLLGAVMLGALYQLIPVVAGARVPAIRLAHGVQGALLVGVSALVAGIWRSDSSLSGLGLVALAAAWVGFLAPVGWALARAQGRGDTVTGLRLAVLALLVLVAMGLRMAWGYAAADFPADRPTWLLAHATLGLVVWVGGLLTSVSWQLVPMFYTAPQYPAWLTRGTLAVLAAALLGVPVALALQAPASAVLWVAAPAVLAVWVVHPIATFILLGRRRRCRADVSLACWRSGLAAGLLLGPLAAATLLAPDPTRWQVCLGWVAIWGWAGLIMHGMLTRIVSFLVWFHRFSSLVGLAPVPPMRRLWPDARARVGLHAHGAAVVIGAAAILLANDALARAAGAAMVVAGIALGYGLLRCVASPTPIGRSGSAPVRLMGGGAKP